MPRIVYVNGDYVPEDQARVSMFDRGYLFGDGAYEVTPVVGRRLMDADRMLARLEASLGALQIAWPMERQDIIAMHEELIARNGLEEGMIYMQITRGVAERDFAFPPRALPVLTAFTKPLSIIDNPHAETGVSVVFVEDIRWKLRNVKSIALLAQVLAKQQAVERRAFEGWMVDDAGFVTEGTSSSAHIVKSGSLITRPLESESGRILPGIRRSVIIDLAKAAGMKVVERPFTPQEAKSADEALLTSATTGVLPVVELEGQAVGSGRPGPVAATLRRLYLEHLEKQVREADQS